MNSDDVVKVLLDFFNAVEQAVHEAKQELAKLVVWEERKPVKPVSEADPAIKWLFNKIEQIRAKHPELQVDFVRDSAGLISSVRFYAPSDEVRKDLLGPLEWALEVAAERPSK